MNTKLLMTGSALALGVAGLLLTFAPEEVLAYLELKPVAILLFLLQLLGALYLGFAMLNWMTKSGLIGGIYNRPVAIANFTHFMIAGLALAKGLYAAPDTTVLVWGIGILYFVFALSFGIILFRHPIRETAPGMESKVKAQA